MQNPAVPKPEVDIPALSVVVTRVSGNGSLLACLASLTRQVDADATEIIVPYDTYSADVAELADVYPTVHFAYVDDLGAAASPRVPVHEHRRYDRCRAVGLSLARGRIVAMTEDHAIPADDWCAQILTAHEQPYSVIGGAIENGVDHPLNRAWYYCDFGRYGRPFSPAEAEYVSDVNVSYKREALHAVRDQWQDAYHEATVHWAMVQRGETLYRDPRPVVHQHRERMPLGRSLRERVDWGRVFAETRAARMGPFRRMLYAAGTTMLVPVLAARVVHHMTRQDRPIREQVTTLLWALGLLTAWSCGEFLGYVRGPIKPLPTT
jgi:hypothetical protein